MVELQNLVKVLLGSQMKTEERFRETDQRFRQTEERIDKLVSAIGEFIRRSEKQA